MRTDRSAIAPAPALAALAALVAVTAACAANDEPHEPPEPGARPVAGCHYFVQDDVARGLNLPWGVRLLDEPLEGWPAMAARGEVRRATTLTGPGERETGVPFGYWLRTPADSIEIGYPGGGGLVLRLDRQGDELVGAARAVGDALRPPAERRAVVEEPVRLTWATCPH